MKKQFGYLLLSGMLLMSGCVHKSSSLASDAFDDTALIQKINERIDEGTFSSVLLRDQSIDEASLQALYGLQIHQIEAYWVHLSVLETPHEIALFQIKEDQREAAAQAIEYHVNNLKERYAGISQYLDLIERRAEGMIGDYYVLIIAEEAQKIMTYMEGL